MTEEVGSEELDRIQQQLQTEKRALFCEQIEEIEKYYILGALQAQLAGANRILLGALRILADIGAIKSGICRRESK